MKRFFSLAFLPLLSAFLFSCEKELVEPSLSSSSVADARTIYCAPYSYENKILGTVSFGKARGEMILVGFAEGMTLEARMQVLNRFPQVQSIDGEIQMDSGTLTRVRLHNGSTCSEAEKLIGKLEKEAVVNFAQPFFESSSDSPDEPWVGLSNEFLVSLEETGTMEQLEKLISQTNTSIVFSFGDDFHLLRADKNSTGSVLEILTFFNQQPSVAVAEPNLVYFFPIEQTEEGEVTSYQTSKTLKKGTFRSTK